MPRKSLSPLVQVSGQVQPAEMEALGRLGFGLIVNNRPDNEDVDQPSSNALEAAAHGAGLQYLHVPVSGVPDIASVQILAAALQTQTAQRRLTLLFCRSGMRSTAAWAMARRLDGVPPDELRAAAASAGYDLSRLPL